jgi:DNA (cytosine-5)-methyltransferase 1
MKKYKKIVSLFSGAGGLDLGFREAGFDIIWANDNDKSIWKTYKENHPKTFLDTRSILDINKQEIPDCDGIIGGPPCQSWSLIGNKKGILDKRGMLIYEYLKIIDLKKPSFFVFENVSGILSPRNKVEFDKFKEKLEFLGYNISFKNINVRDYGVPQDRKRVIVIGIKKEFNFFFDFSSVQKSRLINLTESIFDLNENFQKISNHDRYEGSFSSIFMSRNRIRSWKDFSFTIQASGRHAPLHPSSSPMIKVKKDVFVFTGEVKRLSVRECARIQTFPDNFIFYYSKINDGYKMVGNAVPVSFSKKIANSLLSQLKIT